jgi:hypothetical protein
MPQSLGINAACLLAAVVGLLRCLAKTLNVAAKAKPTGSAA